MWLFFFFQAEDGIRDLVRSRGLGDVYKRQGYDSHGRGKNREQITTKARKMEQVFADAGITFRAVSYTHLTLPTIYSV